jgi:predicted DCC family thiol-disulfide oxidoreductase YuxK
MSPQREDQTKAVTPKAVTVFFDGSCPLCAAEIASYKRADSEDSLALIDVSRDDFLGDGVRGDGGRGDHSLSRSAAMARFHVRLPDGSYASGAQGFVALWRVLPGWRWLAGIDRIPGGVAVLEIFYRGFLNLRPLFVRAFRLYKRAFGRPAEAPRAQVPPAQNLPAQPPADQNLPDQKLPAQNQQ